MAFRLGIISGKFARDLHLIRKIRNQFAHNVYGCDFQDGGVKQRVEELVRSSNDLDLFISDNNLQDKAKTHRGLFLVLSSLFLYELSEKTKEVDSIEGANLEFFYTEYNQNL